METSNPKPYIYKRVVQDNDNSGEMKFQATVELTQWDTSTMSTYKEGDRVLKGYSVKIATLKPNKDKPRGRIDIDPSNVDLRKAIFDMYSAYDKIVKE